MEPDAARRPRPLGRDRPSSPSGNLAPGGSLVKATAIDPSRRRERRLPPARARPRLHVRGRRDRRPSRDRPQPKLQPGDVLVLAGLGPRGTGMEETYQVTSALKFLPWGKSVAVLTDARFSGVSTGACIGHVSPEALAGGPIGRLRDGDVVEIEIDRTGHAGRVDLVATSKGPLTPDRSPEAPRLAPTPSGPRPAPGPSRRHAALGRAPGGERRHLGGLRVRPGPDQPGARGQDAKRRVTSSGRCC